MFPEGLPVFQFLGEIDFLKKTYGVFSCWKLIAPQEVEVSPFVSPKTDVDFMCLMGFPPILDPRHGKMKQLV